MEILDEKFDALADIAGVQVDQIRFILCILSAYPVGWLFNFIKGAWCRHLIGAVLGIFLEYVVYRMGIISMFIQTFLTYFMAKYIKKCGLPIMIQNLAFISAHHIYRQITDYGGWTLDITTILMMAICKFTSFGYSIEDGRKEDSKLTEDQRLRKIEKLPHFLEFFSYIHFFGSSVVGPAFDFYDFRLFINQKGDMKKVPFFGVLKHSIFQMLQGFLYMAGTVLIANQFKMTELMTEEFSNSNWFYKFYFYNFVVSVQRFKYYGGWCLAQGGLVATGMTYNGVDKKTNQHRFDRVETVHPLKVESTHEIKTKVKYWNMSVQKWLERCVYTRMYTPEQIKANKSLANKAQYGTLLVSAFWHGFYPGYYTSFFQWGMMITINKYTWKWATNYPKNFEKLANTITYPVYWTLRFVFYNGLFNFFGCGFQLLSLQNNWKLYQDLYFIPNITVFALTAWLVITNIGQRPPKTPGQDSKKTQ